MPISLLKEKPNRSLYEFEFLQDPTDQNSCLGVGSFATVKLAREKKSNKFIALKMVDLEVSKSKAADLHNLRTEVEIHKKVDHPNIIKYLGHIQESYCIYMALDYAENGNLYSYIHQKKSSLSAEEIFKFFHQTCLAIQYLHRHDVMHRDIKPENLLLDKDFNIKLCDFGWATEKIKDKRTAFCGTYEYMAPEIIHKRPYDYRIDIWSLGVLLYELIHKEAPYKGRSLSEIWNSLSKDTITYCSSIDPHAKDLIQSILRLNPSNRLSIAQILSHPWVKKHLVAEAKDGHNYVHMESKIDKTDPCVDKENSDNCLSSCSIYERPLTSVTHVQRKPRKQSGWLPLQSRSEREKRFMEEQTPTHSGRMPKKSSCTVARRILETLDTEDKKPLYDRKNKENLETKGLSPASKQSLQSIVSPYNHTAFSDDIFNGVLTTNPTSAKETSNHLNKLNKSMTLDSVFYPESSSTPKTFTVLANDSKIATSPNNFNVFVSYNKDKTIQLSCILTNSRPLLVPATSKPDVTASTRQREDQGLKTSKNFENLMNMRPKAKNRTERPERLAFNKLVQGSHNDPKIVFNRNDGRIRILENKTKHKKENKDEL